MHSEKGVKTNDITLSRAVVIGGMPRSGTNLARRIVGSHSLVAVPPAELGFYQKIASGWTIEKILTEPKFLDRYRPDVKDLVHLEGDVVYRHLLARYAASKGKSIPGEKSPLNEFFYRDIQRCFAGCDLRFVHMVRNVLSNRQHQRVTCHLADRLLDRGIGIVSSKLRQCRALHGACGGDDFDRSSAQPAMVTHLISFRGIARQTSNPTAG